MSDDFVLVGRFPLGVKVKPIPNIVVFYNEDTIKINSELDSPVFLFKGTSGLFVQVASPVNGCRILMHEKDVEFLDETGKKIDLYDIDVSPIGG